MAGEWHQETGQSHEYDRVSLERRYEARLERENQVRKRQQVLTLGPENGTPLLLALDCFSKIREKMAGDDHERPICYSYFDGTTNVLMP